MKTSISQKVYVGLTYVGFTSSRRKLLWPMKVFVFLVVCAYHIHQNKNCCQSNSRDIIGQGNFILCNAEKNHKWTRPFPISKQWSAENDCLVQILLVGSPYCVTRTSAIAHRPVACLGSPFLLSPSSNHPLWPRPLPDRPLLRQCLPPPRRPHPLRPPL
jgi:hypothetical protein